MRLKGCWSVEFAIGQTGAGERITFLASEGTYSCSKCIRSKNASGKLPTVRETTMSTQRI